MWNMLRECLSKMREDDLLRSCVFGQKKQRVCGICIQAVMREGVHARCGTLH